MGDFTICLCNEKLEDKHYFGAEDAFVYLILTVLAFLAGGSSSGNLDQTFSLLPPDFRRLGLFRIRLVHLFCQLAKKQVKKVKKTMFKYSGDSAYNLIRPRYTAS